MLQCCCVGQLSCQPVRVQVMSQPANAAGWRQGRLLSPIVVQRGGRNHLLLQLGLRLVLSGRGVDIDLCSKGGLGRNCSLDLLGSASSIFCGSLVIGHGCFFLTWDVHFFFFFEWAHAARGNKAPGGVISKDFTDFPPVRRL